MKIAVVGAGLGGVAAAVGLRREGHEVTLFERGAELREAGTGVVLMPNGTAALDELGLAERVRGEAMAAGNAGLRDWRGRDLLVTDAAEAQRHIGAALVLDRAELHRMLRAPLPGDVVRTGTPIERLEPRADGVRLISEGDEVADADAVIVADGIRSRLRAQLFPAHPGVVGTGRVDLRGTLLAPRGLDVRDLLAGVMIDRRTGAMFGLFPLGLSAETDGLYWYSETPLGDTSTDPAEARDQVLAQLGGWHPTVLALIAATPAEAVYADPIARLAEPLPTLALGRIALLGDAAHAMSPDLGQGASQAFEDAAAITRHLSGATSSEAGQRLLGYDAERRPRTTRMMRASSRQSRLTTQTGPAAWVRDMLLRMVPAKLATRRLATIWHV
ncbi:FAD-dependent monooxygenase [Nonomuraea sp. NBC_01738]|uniref:FAD-dependent oxidoreductase n=1 Tax=Nonomuraea sp. NBC_01738 TaxID=2976003 RepID=UPI002E0FDE54|nr:FAD-dependent monooxygenase [Nonomuraea sp. NBC_01738]